MTQYFVAIHLPDNYDPSLEGEAMERDIDVLNEEMEESSQSTLPWMAASTTPNRLVMKRHIRAQIAARLNAHLQRVH